MSSQEPSFRERPFFWGSALIVPVIFGLLSAFFVSLGVRHSVSYVQTLAASAALSIDGDALYYIALGADDVTRRIDNANPLIPAAMSLGETLGKFPSYLASFFEQKNAFLESSAPPSSPPTSFVPEPPVIVTADEPLTLLFVGDIMLDRGVRKVVEGHAGGEYEFLFSQMKFPRFDILFGNLEGPMSDRGADVGGKYSFRMDPVATPVLAKKGFTILSVANNHSGDWGREAFEDTLRNLNAVGVLAVGGGFDRKEAYEMRVVEKKGKNVGFLGFTDVGPNWLEAGTSTSGIAIARAEALKKTVENSAPKVDLLIVSFHFGEEYHNLPSKRQEELAHAAIDAGADIVVGHHPHVLQKIEEYNGRLIAYSLGNFIFDQPFSKETMRGGMLEVKLSKDGTLGYYLYEPHLNSSFQPSLETEALSVTR